MTYGDSHRNEVFWLLKLTTNWWDSRSCAQHSMQTAMRLRDIFMLQPSPRTKIHACSLMPSLVITINAAGSPSQLRARHAAGATDPWSYHYAAEIVRLSTRRPRVR